MQDAADPLAREVAQFCASIGTDPLLVQGAGGNVSWKSGNVLWVKASGTWLAHARERETFVPVDLERLRSAIRQGRFDAAAMTLNGSALRPSIETMLHALMPGRVVAHLHAVEALAHLIRPDGRDRLARHLPKHLRWGWVPYATPGAPLAACVHPLAPACDALFLASHGIVIGAESISQLQDLLDTICQSLAVAPGAVSAGGWAGPNVECRGYAPSPHDRIHALGRDPQLLHRVERNWALYPDHVVFLGPSAIVIREDALGALPECGPAFAIVRERGVLQAPHAGAGHVAQLGCYLDVLLRQPPGDELLTLSRSEIGQLLGWEAERYRQSIGR